MKCVKENIWHPLIAPKSVLENAAIQHSVDTLRMTLSFKEVENVIGCGEHNQWQKCSSQKSSNVFHKA